MTLYNVTYMMAFAVQGFAGEGTDINAVFEGLRYEALSGSARYTWFGGSNTDGYRYTAEYKVEGERVVVRLYFHQTGEEPDSGICQACWGVPFEGIV
jgi:hypothetical protein